jgi:hypothetical protein
LLHFKADDIIWKSYYRYTSSLVFSGSNFSVSSSRGNVDSFWDIKIQTYYALFHRRHVASIAISQILMIPNYLRQKRHGLFVEIDPRNKHIHHKILTNGIA